jgi:hypothetical protein
MSSPSIPLPPGARLVSDASAPPALPPGATLVSGAIPEQKSVAGFASNVVSSGEKFFGDLGNVVKHPIDTAGAAVNLGRGAIEKATSPAGQPGPHEKYVDAFVKTYVDKYGGWNNIQKSLYEDPVGVASDLATFASGVGVAARGAGFLADAAHAGRVADALATVAKVAGGVSDVTDPLKLAGKAVSIPVKAILAKSELPERIYQSALKPSAASYGLEEAKQMVRTGLDNSIPVTQGGVDKLSGLVDDLNQKIGDVIRDGAQRGVTIDPNAVAQRVDQIRPKFELQVNPERDLKALDASQQEFLRSQGMAPGQPATPAQATGLVDAQGRPIYSAPTPAVPGTPAQAIPADVAQAIKQNTYAQLRSSYGELKNAQIEAQKALARGIKEELGNAFPELQGLNAEESHYLGLQDALERRVRTLDNRDMLGIGAPIVAGVGEVLTGNPKMAVAAGALKAIVDDPAVKSRLAIALNYLRRGNGPASGRAAATATAASRVQDYIDQLRKTVSPPDADAENDRRDKDGPIPAIPGRMQPGPAVLAPAGAQ